MVLILSGGGLSENLTKEFFNRSSGAKVIGVIPNAREKDEYGPTLKWVGEKLLFGKKEWELKLVDLNQTLDEFDGIIIGGGNTFKLLKDISDSGAKERIIDFAKSDKPLYGISAGAIIMGAEISTAYTTDRNKVNLEDLSGLDLFDGASFECHHEESNSEKIQKICEEKNSKIIALPENSGLVWAGGKNPVKFFGNVSVFTRR